MNQNIMVVDDDDDDDLTETSVEAQASVDPRTLEKILRGEAVSGLAGDRARKILVEAGLLNEQEQAA